jgi:hypothetical protein
MTSDATGSMARQQAAALGCELFEVGVFRRSQEPTRACCSEYGI